MQNVSYKAIAIVNSREYFDFNRLIVVTLSESHEWVSLEMWLYTIVVVIALLLLDDKLLYYYRLVVIAAHTAAIIIKRILTLT